MSQGCATLASPPLPSVYAVGTLRYTKAALVTLFLWLLWGDVCFTVMEAIIPSILPLKLQHLNAPNTLIGFLLTTVFSAMNFVLNPIISFRSDRYRSRLGRRIPFLLFATPFITIFLCLMAFSDSLGAALHRAMLFGGSVNQVTIALLAVLIVGFQFFNLFVASVYYYLFNDVVPALLLGRFLALFRIVGTLAGAAYNYFIFQYAESHTRLIFLGAAGFYVVVFTLMCWKVKEGEYPPPPANVDGHRGIMAAIKTYAVECFTHRVYWTLFFVSAFASLAQCMASFQIFFYQSVGLTLRNYGQIMGVSGLVTAGLLYPAGILADKYHPIRISILGMGALVLVMPLNLIFLLVDLQPNGAFWMMVATTAVTLPAAALYQAGEFPLFMRMLPKERYGQFCSAAAMVRSVGLILGGIAAGAFIDMMKWFHPQRDYYFRYVPLWIIGSYILALVFLLRLRKDWLQHGGPKSYVPPSVWQ